MSKYLIRLTAVFLLLASVALIGCGQTTPPPADNPPVATDPESENPAGEETAVANFTILFGEVEYLIDDSGSNAIKISYEFINKGETAIPSEISSVRATQGGEELASTSTEGSTGSVDYQVRGGGSVQCFVVFQLLDDSEVTLDFLNVTDPSAPAVLSKTVSGS